MKVRKTVLCALFASMICVGAPFNIPIGAMPVTLGLFFVALTAFCIDTKECVAAIMVYILIGMAGFPVFSGFKGGVGVLLSPTGGFLVSYVLIAPILSQVKYSKTKFAKAVFSAMALLLCYVCGTAWYMIVTKAELLSALALCVLPFVIFDVIKIYVAYKTAKMIRKRIKT